MNLLGHYERVWHVKGRWDTWTTREREAESVRRDEGAEVVEYVRADLHRGGVGFERRAHDWIAFVAGDRNRWEAGDSPEECLTKLRVSHPDHFGGQ